jgi:hypothetical protein
MLRARFCGMISTWKTAALEKGHLLESSTRSSPEATVNVMQQSQPDGSPDLDHKIAGIFSMGPISATEAQGETRQSRN